MNGNGIYGKNGPKEGRSPAIALINPKYPHNVAKVVRAASCYNFGQVWYTGNRIKLDEKKRLPREERMRGYKDVELRQFDKFLEQFEPDVVPVAVDLVPQAESLPQFVHPKKAVYLFGPEDGTIPQTWLRLCHRFVAIPTRHCLNLATAVSTILYDRLTKLDPYATIQSTLNEPRHWVDSRNDEDNFHKELGLL